MATLRAGRICRLADKRTWRSTGFAWTTSSTWSTALPGRSSRTYKLNVGDEIRVESFTDPQLDRELLIQPDGTIALRLLGQVKATGRTITQLRDDLEKLYEEYYKVPSITVTPLRVNSKLEDLRATVDRRYGEGGQNRLARSRPKERSRFPCWAASRPKGSRSASCSRS